MLNTIGHRRDFSPGAVSRGMVWMLALVMLALAAAQWRPTARAQLGGGPGAPLTPTRDFDADGVPDYLAPRPIASYSAPAGGEVRVYSGATRQMLYRVIAAEADDHFGTSVDSLGDVNGDGKSDFIVGAPMSGRGDLAGGAFYVFSGSDGSLLHNVVGARHQRLGQSVAGVGDVDRDGVPDIAAGSMRFDSEGVPRGVVEIRSGSAPQNVLASIEGPQGDPSFGLFVRGLGDCNADGAVDIAISSPGERVGPDELGVVRVFQGDPAPLPAFTNRNWASAESVITSGRGDITDFGQFVFLGRDVDLDGKRDLVIGNAHDMQDGAIRRVFRAFDTATGAVKGATDPTPLMIKTDNNADLLTDAGDVLQTVEDINQTPPPGSLFSSDVDGDGVVTAADVAAVISDLGKEHPLKELSESSSDAVAAIMANAWGEAGQCGEGWVLVGDLPHAAAAGLSEDGGFVCCVAVTVPFYVSELGWQIHVPGPCGGDDNGDDDPESPNYGNGPLPSLGWILWRFGFSGPPVFWDDPTTPDGDGAEGEGGEGGGGGGGGEGGNSSPSDRVRPRRDVGRTRPNPGEEQRSEIDAQDEDLGREGANEATCNPVALAEGIKVEKDVDLIVPLPGRDFKLARTYDGGAAIQVEGFPWLIGNGWGATVDGWVVWKERAISADRVIPSPTNLYDPWGETVEVVRFPLDQGARFYVSNADDGLFIPFTPSSQTVTRRGLTVRGQDIPTFVYDVPGQGQSAYYNTRYSADSGLRSLHGRLLQERDAFGNCWTYQYVLHTTDRGPARPLLHRIELRPAGASDNVAVVEFEWDIGQSPYQPGSGRCREARVLRPVANGFMTVQYARYTYRGDDPAYRDLYPLDDCLILVEQGTLVNAPPVDSDLTQVEAPEPLGPPEYHVRFTHYRYDHYDQQTDDPAQKRRVSRLTYVFEPLQVERYAQHAAAGPESQSQAEAMRAAARQLARSPLSAAVGATGRSVSQFAGKIIVYNPPAGEGYEPEEMRLMVRSETLLNGCGCSGSDSQDMRIEFSYARKLVWDYRRTWDGAAEFSPEVSTLKLGRWSRVTIRKESISDPDAGNWGAHKTVLNWSEDRPLGLGMSVAILTGPPTNIRQLHLNYTMVPFVTANAVFEGDWPNHVGRSWWTFHEFESHNSPVRTYHASALAGMSIDQHGLLDYPANYDLPLNIRAAAQFREGGRAEWRQYDNLGRETRAGVARVTAGGSLVDKAVVQDTEYAFGDLVSSNNGWRTDLVSKVSRPVQANSTGAGPREEIEYFYYLRQADGLRRPAVATMIERRKRELLAEGGEPGEPYVDSGVSYDEQGNERWRLAPDGSLTYNLYDEFTGALLRTVHNADPSAHPWLPASFASSGRHADGGSLESLQLVDLLGRPLVRISEKGVRTDFSYALSRPTLCDPFDFSESPGMHATRVPLLKVTALPHDFGPGAAPRYTGPRVEQWVDAAFNVVRSSSFDAQSGRESARTVQLHDLGGRMIESRTWHDVANNLSYVERFETDALGRARRTVDGVGEVTEWRYDLFDRITEVRRGVIGHDAQVVERRFYDHTGTLSAPTSGAGDGNLTLVQKPVSESETRSEVSVFDWRKRLRLTYLAAGSEGVALPGVYSATIYDNLDRPRLSAAVSGGDMQWLAAPLEEDSIDIFTNQIEDGRPRIERIVEPRYSARGLVYEQRTRVFPPGDTTYAGVGMRSRTWFDAAGRSVAVLTPTGPVSKITFDGLGRAVRTALTDGRAMRASETVTYADATSLDGPDATLEDVRTTFDSVGNPVLVSTRQRRHDAPESEPSLSDAFVSTYMATVYDQASRPIATVDFGAGAAASAADQPFAEGGAAPSVPLVTVPPRSDGIRVVESHYDSVGRLLDVVDELGRSRRTLHDDLDRAIATVDNHKPSGPGGIGVERDGLGMWSLTGFPAASAPDENRVVSLVYNAAGDVTHRIAHNVVGGHDKRQITRSIYAYADGSTDVVAGLQNEAVSNHLLREVRYPDTRTGPGEGLPSDLPQDRVRFAYNRAGEATARLDQNGALFVYTRDAAGRVVSEVIEDRGASAAGVDLTAREVRTAYDSSGRVVSTVLSRGGPGAVLNEMTTEFDFMGRPLRIRQNPLAAVGAPGTRDIDLEWKPIAATGYNSLDRLDAVVYPSAVGSEARTRVAMEFGAAGSIDNLISRLSGYAWNAGADAVSHSRLGAARRVATTLNAPGQSIVRDRTVDPETGARAPGVYPGLDHFGRVRRHLWTLGPLAAAPTRPPIVDRHYLYDAAGNTTARLDARPGVQVGRSERHRYDELDRLVESVHGDSLAVPLPGSERWSLDRIGNWTSSERTTAQSPTGYDQSESFTTNATNELLSRTPGGAPAQAFEYDPTGNLTSERLADATDAQGAPTHQRRKSLTYDAWGRLLRVALQTRPSEGASWTTSRTLAAYTYYAGNQRATRTARAARSPSEAESGEGSGGDDPDERTLYYYDAEWRSLEEHTQAPYSGPWTNAPAAAAAFATVPDPSSTRITQNIWDPTVQDELVQVRAQIAPGSSESNAWWAITDRRRDLAALVRTSPDAETGGPVVERVRYSSWGLPTFEHDRDINADGIVSVDDAQVIGDRLGAVLGDATGLYRADADLDYDGDNDATDVILVGRGYDQRTHRGALWDSIPTSIAYAAAHYDRATGLLLMRHRWYDPALGRWVTRDPAGYVDGMSLYMYVAGNPWVYWDPFGLKSACSLRDLEKQNGLERGVGNVDNSEFWTPEERAYQQQEYAERAEEFKETGKTYLAVVGTAVVSAALTLTPIPGDEALVGAAFARMGWIVKGGKVLNKAGKEVSEKAIAKALKREVERVKKGAEKAKNAAEKERKATQAHEGSKKTSKIDRNAFRKERETYWKKEAENNPEKYSPEDIARMKDGKAPIGPDGKPVELHHVDRTPEGGVVPMSKTEHRIGDNYKKNHPPSSSHE